ncbi:YdeI/OmpD-associated family protein [Stratiformator vulcanicus]|uniref:Bacteriocin-protection, YdeI or OmpD-Associated n=1 Tax=Stratiformator vulcanicus TaxID=2527980 RepID=A0A517R7D4_9PLAN|nr:YdeI/OmpD-associated family protein [Stratiformator vulcanicus]QDT39772.1 hypothetical protein Pan189_41830 [Stratiformator vulcanicus]
MPSAIDELEHVEVASRDEWRHWLAEHHEQSESIWLVTYRKAVPEKYLPYDAIVEEALCFGWIDSRPGKVDTERTKLLISPRKPGSPWSRLNKQRVERLESDGLMTPAGWAKIEQAKADGSWTVLDDVEDLVIPPDLAKALKQNRSAKQHFDAFPDSVKKGILWWIKSAKRSATREKRIAETVAKAAENVRANYP